MHEPPGGRIAKARALLDGIAAEERADPLIAHPSRWWLHDEVVPTAVVLVHGLTNSPPQYDVLGPQLRARGHAVLDLRLPYHGYRDRMSDAVAKIRARDMQSSALQAVVIGALCAERVVVLGISVGATLAGWLAARTRIDLGVAVAPFCGLHQLPGAANDAFGATLRGAPNAFGWWDPRAKERQPPSHGYPRFSTRALGESLLISTEMERGAGPEHGRRVVLVDNANDPVVNNAHADRRFRALQSCGVGYERVTLCGLPAIHDIIEPAIPQAVPDLVYPKLIEIIETA